MSVHRLLLVALATSLAVSVYKQVDPSPNPSSSPSQMAYISEQYNQWKRQYGRLYGSPAEDTYRKEVFAKNFLNIMEVNRKKRSYTLGLNQFADMTIEEIKSKYTGLGVLHPEKVRPAKQTSRLLSWWDDIFGDPEKDEKKDDPKKEDEPENNEDLAESVDWSKEGTINPVIHQGGCGACYAFATASSLEHNYFQKTKQLIQLSPQELVDCSKGQGNGGCRGGWMHQAYEYIKLNKGLQLLSTYPYKSMENQFCSQDASKNIPLDSLFSSHTKIESHDPAHIKRALQKYVVPSGIDMTKLTFYSSGVYDDEECSANIQHAVVIVGYGVNKDGVKYWKIKNTYGDFWGEKGYLYLKRHDSNRAGLCGITQYNVYASLE